MTTARPKQGAARIQQLVLDLYGCVGDLDGRRALEMAIRRGCRAVDATVVKIVGHLYRPQGLTLVAILLESHIVVATWPEHRFATVEIFLCNPAMDPEKVAEPILEVLGPARRLDHRLEHCVGGTGPRRRPAGPVK
ncbi:MAG: S-adenosylmethionine decarboxylase [Candidatus Riflebacteria bacterium]|nr:S-adenosylmethionine decarboxylase [Candidatus Riflebacteria bacterium]